MIFSPALYSHTAYIKLTASSRGFKTKRDLVVIISASRADNNNKAAKGLFGFQSSGGKSPDHLFFSSSIEI